MPRLPSGDTCRSYELGIHGRHPASCGPEMLLKPCELDHHHRQAAQIRSPARATEETLRSRRTGVRSGLCLGTHGVSSLLCYGWPGGVIMPVYAGEKLVSAGFVAGSELGPRGRLDDIRSFLRDTKRRHSDSGRHCTYCTPSRAAER